MAITNVSGNRTQKTLHQLICTAAVTVGAPHPLTYLSVLNILLSMTAFLGNVLILVALHKVSSLHPPSKLLLRCLAITDLFVGLIAQPIYAGYEISLLYERWNMCRSTFASSLIAGYVLCGVSLPTLSAISVDRLLALLLGLRYRQVVTMRRMFLFVMSFWVMSSFAAVMYFFNYLVTLSYCYLIVSLCVTVSIISYTKIFLTLHRHQVQVQDSVHQQQPSQIIPLNITRYRKAVSSALWLQLTLIICYLPHGMVEFVLAHSGLSPAAVLARQFTATLVFSNSSLNPLLYCWKIKEVRRAVKDTIRQVRCCSTC
ncbi:melanocyte-stimulating hormone receptor-like [Orbicella faveolata]|uniref:melanocyte-stimulating hormone receptor-like n=1 Tax=Orbicella faveolata TaxID=48498 RepID=UPI0009E37E8C|nr:melanocyte-stimulating hormone receptor-like [Orbicella faveolata]